MKMERSETCNNCGMYRTNPVRETYLNIRLIFVHFFIDKNKISE